MPTKPNRAGNQQNYVPAGNGDASGEYGDNATGSNIHISISKKESSINEQTIVKPKKEDSNANHKERVSNYIKAHTNIKGQALKVIEENIEEGNEDCNRMLANALEKGDYSYESGRTSYYRNSSKTIVMAKKDAESQNRVKGEVFYHESGHLIDFQNKQAFGDTINQPLSCSYVSKKYNRTMQEMVKEEGNLLLNFRQSLLAEVKEDKEKIENDYIEKSGLTTQQIFEHEEMVKQQRNQLNDITERYGKVKDEAASELYAGKISYLEYNQKYAEILKKQQKETADYLAQNADITKKINDTNNKIFEAKTKAYNEFSKKYADLSDMIDAATSGRLTLSCGSHGGRYWRSNNQNQAVEFFAEIYSAKATKNEASYNMIKKYYPKSVEIFEELLRENV